MDPLSNEKMFGFLKTAMDAASARHQMSASNMANIDTPGYKARSMDFHAVMRDYEAQMNMQPDPKTVRDGNPLPPPQPFNFKDYIVENESGHLVERIDGNNVQLEEEMATMANARSRYKLASMFMTRKIRLLNESMEVR